MLKLLQKELPRLWTDEQYSAQFKANPSPYKDFDHALKHIQKAAQQLVDMVEMNDHLDFIAFPKADLEKYLADIVISVVRASLVSPSSQIDLERAVINRIETKMKVRFDPESHLFRSASEGRQCGFWVKGVPCQEIEPCPAHGTKPETRY